MKRFMERFNPKFKVGDTVYWEPLNDKVKILFVLLFLVSCGGTASYQELQNC
jgi:hypothetical protein